MIDILNKEINHEKWTSIIKAQQLSGQSRKSWCLENDVNIHNFIYWNKRLPAKTTTKSPQSSTEEFEWASVLVSEESSEIIIEINSVKIYLKANFDEQLLVKLIRTLKAI